MVPLQLCLYSLYIGMLLVLAYAQEGKPLIFIGHKDALIDPAYFQPEQYMTYVSMSAYELNYMTKPQFFSLSVGSKDI